MNFGYILRTLRISAGISLRELSRMIDVSPTYLSLVENGKQSPPNAVRIAQIEKALDVPSGYLLSIVNGLNSEARLFVRQMPEVVDFINVAKGNSMSSTDFMELTSFLNLYGWKGLRQALEKTGFQPPESSSDSPNKTVISPYVWPFLYEGFIFDIVGVKGKRTFLEEAVSRIAAQCNGLQPEAMLTELLEREEMASTGVGSGVALPHACVPGLEQTIVSFMRIPEGLDFDAIDGEPVYMALLLAGPPSSENLHLRLLARIAKLLSHNNFCESVLGASSPREIISIFRSAEMRIP